MAAPEEIGDETALVVMTDLKLLKLAPFVTIKAPPKLHNGVSGQGQGSSHIDLSLRHAGRIAGCTASSVTATCVALKQVVVRVIVY